MGEVGRSECGSTGRATVEQDWRASEARRGEKRNVTRMRDPSRRLCGEDGSACAPLLRLDK